MTPGITEIHAGTRSMVQFVGGKVVPQPVAAVVGKPQLTGCGVKCQSDTVAYAAGIDYIAAAIGKNAPDLAKTGFIANIAGSANRHISS